MEEKTNEAGKCMAEATMTTEAEKRIFEHECYETYRLYWIFSSEKKLQELSGAIHILATELMEANPTSTATKSEKQAFARDSEFCEAIWASEEEFMKKEFRDPSYMKTMLSGRNNGAEMWKFYQEHYAPGLNEYTVTLKVEGRFVVTTRAKSIRKAKESAISKYMDVDFGPLQDINSKCIIVEDENGNFLWATGDPEPDEK